MEQPSQEKIPRWRLAAAAVGVLGVAALGVHTGSGMVDTYCERRDTFAPGGEATPAPLCDANDGFRSHVAELIAIATQ